KKLSVRSLRSLYCLFSFYPIYNMDATLVLFYPLNWEMANIFSKFIGFPRQKPLQDGGKNGMLKEWLGSHELV
ncbi:MAG: hypothetical protein Q4D98_14115, partial [Planctomycetia bacterium]|nr:hypothetical protein [Planctomycetia bacterium]